MKFTFDTPVSSVLAFLNYAPGSGNPYMAIYDSNDNLLDQHFLSISTPNAKNGGQNWGFSLDSSIIKSYVLGDAYIVASGLRTVSLQSQVAATPVPGPGTLSLLALAGFGCCGDVNGDQLEDVFFTGAKVSAAGLFLQDKNGSFAVSSATTMVSVRW